MSFLKRYEAWVNLLLMFLCFSSLISSVEIEELSYGDHDKQKVDFCLEAQIKFWFGSTGAVGFLAEKGNKMDQRA